MGTDAAELLRRIYEDGFSRGDEAVFEECYHPSFVHHSKIIADLPAGGAGEAAAMHLFRQSIPDVNFRIVEFAADGTTLAARVHITGTAEQAFGSVPAGLIDIHGVGWFRTTDTQPLQVTEEWFFADSSPSPQP